MFKQSVNLPVGQILKFGAVGVLATLVHSSVGYLSVIAWDLPGMVGNVVGFASAWWVSFFGHHLFTFEGRADNREAFIRFVLHSVGLFALASLITAGLTLRTGLVPDSMVPVVGACLVPVVSFLSSKYFVFRSAR